MDLAQTMKSKDIERGHGNPSLRTVQKILDVLGMEINYQVRKVVP